MVRQESGNKQAYSGTFTLAEEPDFEIPIKLQILTETQGSWTVLGQTEQVSIRREGKNIVFTANGTKMEGQEMENGMLVGSVTQKIHLGNVSQSAGKFQFQRIPEAAAPRVARFEEDEASPQDSATDALLWEPRVIKTETHLGEVTRVKDIEQGTEQGEGAAETKGQLSQYGAVEAAPAQDVKAPRSGISPVILIGAIFVPVVIFVITFIFSCTSIRYFHWVLSYIILATILGCIIWDPNVRKLHHDFQSPMGRMFKVIQVTNLFAWLMGAVDGYGNYIVNFKPYYDMERLAHYPAVDPSVFSGNMYMDAGQIDFFYNSKLDLTRTAGFKSQDIYCVAPIVGPTSQVINGAFAKQDNYDFWAVGINCCSGHSSDYQCGEFSNVNANKGLRLMRDDLKSYFRLAVEEAQAQYGIQARTPVFVYFMESPQDEIDNYLRNGWMELFHAFFGLIALQTCIVGLASSCYIYNSAV